MHEATATSEDEALLPMVRTCGLNALPGEIGRQRPDLIISICGDTRDRIQADAYLKEHDVPVLRMQFHDIEHVSSNHSSMIAPTIGAFEKLFADIDLLFPVQPVENLLVHCSMGVSRSPAVAFVAAGHIAKGFYLEMNEELWAQDCVERFFGRQPFSAPNKRVLKIGERLLGSLGRCISKEVRTQTGELRDKDECPGCP